MSDKEIAECLNMPKRTVKYGKNRALNQMRKFMEIRSNEKKKETVKLSHRHRSCGILCLCEMNGFYKPRFGGMDIWQIHIG